MMVSSGGDPGLQLTAGRALGTQRTQHTRCIFNKQELSYFVVLKIMGMATDLLPSTIYRKQFAESNHFFHQNTH